MELRKENPKSCKGNLFNDFDYGGYLIWQLPSKKVFIDGRMPSWRDSQGEKYYSIYTQIITDSSFMKKEFQQYHISCALVGDDQSWQPFIDRLRSEGWKMPVKSNGGVLLTSMETT